MLGACSINQVILMGRLTSDPELRQTQSGVSTCRFTVAITRAFQNPNGERQSDFITCVAWRQTAEFICRNFSKGRIILVEGDLRSSSYDDRNHPDVKHYVTEVYVNNASFGETKASAGQGGGYSGQSYGGQGYSQNQGYGNNQNYSNQNNQSFQQNGYQQPQPPVSVGDLSDFEEVISDSDLPF